jgi:hypothetical protein
LERAQLVWQRAVALARSDQDSDRFVPSLDLLGAAHHSQSTMLHALHLGRARLLATPADIPTRDAVLLLARTISWLGRPTEQDEVGTARSPAPDRSRVAHLPRLHRLPALPDRAARRRQGQRRHQPATVDGVGDDVHPGSTHHSDHDNQSAPRMVIPDHHDRNDEPADAARPNPETSEDNNDPENQWDCPVRCVTGRGG